MQNMSVSNLAKVRLFDAFVNHDQSEPSVTIERIGKILVDDIDITSPCGTSYKLGRRERKITNPCKTN